jgi:hypothetical protein
MAAIKSLMEFPPSYVPTLYDDTKMDAKRPEFDPVCALVVSTVTDMGCARCETKHQNGCTGLLECQGYNSDGWVCNGMHRAGGCRSNITGPNQSGDLVRFGCPQCKRENAEYYLCEECFWVQEKFRGRVSGNSRQINDLFTTIDKDSHEDGETVPTLELEELQEFCEGTKGRRIVEAMPSGLHGLLYPGQLKSAFNAFDEDQTGSMDGDEWKALIETIEFLYLRYCLQVSSIQMVAFFGRGQRWSAGNADEREYDIVRACAESSVEVNHMLQISLDPDTDGGLIPEGWWDDFVYYNVNVHPLLGILFCDPNHTLDRLERICMEISTIGLVIIIEARRRAWDVSWSNNPSASSAPYEILAHPVVFTIAASIIPMMTFYFLFYMFTCQCGLVDEYRATEAEKARAKSCERGGSWSGRGLMAVLIGFAILTLVRYGNSLSFFIIAFSRCYAYVFHLLLALAITFNPVIAWGQPNPALGDGGFSALVGLGQWRIEKQRFQARCRRVHSQYAAIKQAKSGSWRSRTMTKEEELIDPTAGQLKLGRTVEGNAGDVFSFSGRFFSQWLNCCNAPHDKKNLPV